MDSKKVKQFLEIMKSDPKAAELLKGYESPADQAEEIRIYAEIAEQLEYDITEEDLNAYMEKLTALTSKRTETAASQIEELSDEVLDQVAGGKDHKNCKDTYKNKENCWVTDGCDNVFNKYDDYVCHVLNWDNPCHETAEPCSSDAYCNRTWFYE